MTVSPAVSPSVVAAILMIAFFLVGMHVAAALGLIGVALMLLFSDRPLLDVLGQVGWNAGAGMTGGVAYITEWRQLNADSVVAREVPPEDADELRTLIAEHGRRTGSSLAAAMLSDWESTVARFRQIVPVAAASPERVADAVEHAQVRDGLLK